MPLRTLHQPFPDSGHVRHCRRVESPLDSFLLELLVDLNVVPAFDSILQFTFPPTKLVPLSDPNSSGGPLRLTNCRKAIMKSSVSNDGTSSKKTARVVKQVNKHPQRFAEPRPHLTISGPKKST